MFSKVTTITNELGLHARSAAVFVRLSQTFSSDIWIRATSVDGDFVNAKSIIKVLGLNLERGEKIELSAEGFDEREAVMMLAETIEKGFAE